MGNAWQVQKYKIEASPVYVLLCVQQIQNYKIQNAKYVLLCAQPGAYRRSDCPAADSTQSGEEPRWKSLLCSKMDKVELENRVELESKNLENMVELEKQVTDLHSRVGAELKMCGVQFVIQSMMRIETAEEFQSFC